MTKFVRALLVAVGCAGGCALLCLGVADDLRHPIPPPSPPPSACYMGMCGQGAGDVSALLGAFVAVIVAVVAAGRAAHHGRRLVVLLIDAMLAAPPGVVVSAGTGRVRHLHLIARLMPPRARRDWLATVYGDLADEERAVRRSAIIRSYRNGAVGVIVTAWARPGRWPTRRGPAGRSER
jgi:hypothetical protein